MAKYTYSHTYMARVTHEVTYDVPDDVPADQARDYILNNGLYPEETEAVDEDFIEDVDWELLSVRDN